MKNIDESLEVFSNVVLEKAFAVRDSIEKDLMAKKEIAVNEKELQYYEDAYKKIQENKAKIIQECNETSSKVQIECKKALIMKRGEIINEVFGDVYRRIADFISTDEYGKWLYDCICSAIDSVYTNGEEIQVDLCKNDEKHIPSLQKELDGKYGSGVVEISITEDDILGGAIVFNKTRNVLSDNTIKHNIENVKNDFLKYSGLTIE